MFSLLLSGVHSAKKESIAKLAGVGDQLELKCVVAEEIKNCIFRNPAEDNLFMFVGADIENGRVVNSAFGLNEATGRYECNMMIKNVKDTDNGRWECSVIAINEGQQKTVTRYFQVTVAVPPEQLYLEENNQKRPNELKFGMSSEEKKVSCIAENVRPKPEFVWYIGDNKMNVAAEDFDRDWNKTTMKATYGQTFSYYPSKEHNDKSLVCEINHSGYTDAQKADEANKVAVRLLITFPPETQDKVDTVDLSALTKKGLDGGQSVGKTVPIRKTFSANPMPTECYWQIGQNETAVVKCGQKSEDDKYLSSNVEQGDDENRWTVVLDIDISQFAKEDTPEDVTLIVGNGEGKAAYKFNLTAAEDVTTTSKRTGGAQASMTAVAVVIVVLILVVVSIVAYARVKGLLCFAAKSNDALDEEKEAFDNAEKGEAVPIVPAAKGDSGPPAKPPAAESTPEKKADVIGKDVTSSSPENKSKDNKEEDKKSNGAHTPC